MEQREVTEEQKAKLKTLARAFNFRLIKAGIRFSTILFLSNFVILLMDTFYVHNQSFAVFGTAINFIFNFRSYHLAIRAEHDKVEKEVKEILEN